MNPELLRMLSPAKAISQNNRCADNDQAIILPIVILLLADKGDFFLILSLIYILL